MFKKSLVVISSIFAISKSFKPDPVHQSSQFSVSVAEPRLLANAAIESLSTVQDKPGVWDIFISRVVEVCACRQPLVDDFYFHEYHSCLENKKLASFR